MNTDSDCSISVGKAPSEYFHQQARPLEDHNMYYGNDNLLVQIYRPVNNESVGFRVHLVPKGAGSSKALIHASKTILHHCPEKIKYLWSLSFFPRPGWKRFGKANEKNK